MINRNKYGARRTEVDGISFASMAEANRYKELKFLERHGRIRNLELQPRFPLEVNGIKVCTYIGDFRYELASSDRKGAWTKIVEDVKGVCTREFQLKAKLLFAVAGVRVEIVRNRKR